MSNPASTQVLYSERVTPKWTSFLPISLVLPTFWLTFAPINPVIGLISGLVMTLAIIWLMLANSPQIEVTTQEIKVGKARIPLAFTGVIEEIPPQDVFNERGPRLDTRAYVCLQGSRQGLIRMTIADKKDPTPYWLFSAKNTSDVLEAVSKAKTSK